MCQELHVVTCLLSVAAGKMYVLDQALLVSVSCFMGKNMADLYGDDVWVDGQQVMREY